MAKVLLVGVESTMARQIRDVLEDGRHEVAAKTCSVATPELRDAELVFVGGDPSRYLPLVRRAKAEYPGLPIVVVTRLPETTEWLDAIEAGATDYCAAPLSTSQLHWLLEAALPKQVSATA